jgi:hypothetical protein
LYIACKCKKPRVQHTCKTEHASLEIIFIACIQRLATYGKHPAQPLRNKSTYFLLFSSMSAQTDTAAKDAAKATADLQTRLLEKAASTAKAAHFIGR